MTPHPRIICPICTRRPGRLLAPHCPACHGTGTVTLGPLADTEPVEAVAGAAAMGYHGLAANDDDGNLAVTLELHDAGFVDLEDRARARTIRPTPDDQPAATVNPATGDLDVGPGHVIDALHRFRTNRPAD